MTKKLSLTVQLRVLVPSLELEGPSQVFTQSGSVVNLQCRLVHNNRQRRIDYDLVQDQAEKELLKEIELISSVQSTLAKTLQQTKDQLQACREAKHRLEMDWSDKYSAQNLGGFLHFTSYTL